MAYQGLAFEIEVELSSVNGRVCGVEGDAAFSDAAIVFWRDVRQLGRRADLALDGYPDLLAFWSAEREYLVSSAEHLLRVYLSDALTARFQTMLQDAAGEPAGTELFDDCRLVLDQILYAPFRLVFRVSPGAVRWPLDLYGFSCLVHQAVVFAVPDILGCRGDEFIRVRSFLPSAQLIGGFQRTDAEQRASVPLSPEGRPVGGDLPSAAEADALPTVASVSLVPGVSAAAERDWSQRFYQLLHPVPVFGFLAACYALFLMLSAEGERQDDRAVLQPPAVVEQTGSGAVVLDDRDQSVEGGAGPSAEAAAERPVREDSPNVRYVPEN